MTTFLLRFCVAHISFHFQQHSEFHLCFSGEWKGIYYVLRGSWRVVTNPISQFIFFPNPTSQLSNPIPFLIFNIFPIPSPSVAWTPFSQGKTCQSQFPFYLVRALIHSVTFITPWFKIYNGKRVTTCRLLMQFWGNWVLDIKHR